MLTAYFCSVDLLFSRFYFYLRSSASCLEPVKREDALVSSSSSSFFFFFFLFHSSSYFLIFKFLESIQSTMGLVISFVI